VFDVTGKNPLIDIAVELERIALQEDYFVTRKLYPNVDFYSGIIYEAMKFPMDMFPVLFRHRADAGMAGAVAGDAARQGAEDRPPASDLHGTRQTGLTWRSSTEARRRRA